MNKKIVILALAVLALIALALAAVGMNKASDADLTADGDMAIQAQELGGRIDEIADAYILITDSELGQVQVNLGDDTLYDGADLDELSAGQSIQVLYDGSMTRSLPPQVFALKVALQ